MNRNKSNGFGIIFMTIFSADDNLPPRSPLISITLVGFVLTIGLGYLLDQFGVSSLVIQRVELALALSVPICVAWFSRTMILQSYFHNGRRLTQGQGIAATGMLLAGAYLPLIRTSSDAADSLVLLGSALCALVVLGLTTGLGLRRSEAFSLRQWLCNRFPEVATRSLVSAVILLSCAGICLSALETATQMLMGSFHLTHLVSEMISCGLILLPLLLGGLSASLIIANFTLVLLLAAYALPFLVQGFVLPSVAGLHIRWTGLIPEIFVLGFGLATLPALLGPSLAAITPRRARMTSLSTLVWGIIGIAALLWPVKAYYLSWMGAGPSELLPAGTANQEIGHVLTLSLGTPAIFENIMRVAAYVLGINFAIAAFQACAANLTEGFDPPEKDFRALSSQRLARNRLAVIFLVVLAALIVHTWHIRPEQYFEIAIGLNAAGLLPIVLLALWPKAKSDAALITYYVTIGAMAGLFIHDQLISVREHLISGILYSIPAAVLGGILIAISRQKREAQAPAPEDHV